MVVHSTSRQQVHRAISISCLPLSPSKFFAVELYNFPPSLHSLIIGLKVLGVPLLKTYINSNEEEYLGAYKRLTIGNGGIVTTVKASVILEGVNRTTRRNLYISIVILAIAILCVYFFAKTLSSPLKRLSRVVNEINQNSF